MAEPVSAPRDDRLDRLIARARHFDGHPPFSDGALADLATGLREVVWAEGDVGAAVRTVARGSVAERRPEALEGVLEAAVGVGPSRASGTASVTEAEFVIDPDARRHGHGRALLHRLLVDAPGEVLFWAHGGHPAARRLAASHGLEPVRELLHLRGEVPAAPAPLAEFAYIAHPARETWATLANSASREGAVDALLAVNARAFAEHPEQGRMTRAEFDALAAEPWFDPEDVLLAWDGDTLVGFCWLKVEGASRAPSRTSGHRSATGEFYVVGVDPAAQGQGWGRRLVAAGMARLASRGIQHAHLYVEADNAPALRLYREFGFHEDSVDIQYRWRADPGH